MKHYLPWLSLSLSGVLALDVPVAVRPRQFTPSYFNTTSPTGPRMPPSQALQSQAATEPGSRGNSVQNSLSSSAGSGMSTVATENGSGPGPTFISGSTTTSSPVNSATGSDGEPLTPRPPPTGLTGPTTFTDVETDRDGNPVQTDDSNKPRPTRKTTTPANCIDTEVTYTNAIPETVYVTVEVGYNVTVSAKNASMTAPTLFETPREPCRTKLVADSFGPVFPNIPDRNGSIPVLTNRPLPPKTFTPPLLLKETSTVIVTKKTPVEIIQTATITDPPIIIPQGPNTDIGPGLPSQGTNQPSEGGRPGSSNDGNQSKDTGGPTGGPKPAPGDGSSGRDDGQPVDGGSPQISAIQSVGSGLASIIASVINSPFVPLPANPTQGFVAAPATPIINGIAVTIGPSSVAIGSQFIALPASAQTTVVVGSQTFTVRPSEIVAAGTTFRIANELAVAPTITQAPSVVTTAGVVFTVGVSAAVISGTTYRVGSDAPQTTIVVGGQTIAVGRDGVVILGANPTTFAPPMTIAGGYEIVVVNGLTLSVAQTVAVVSGTTYRIGAGASTTTININGTTLTIGPSGVALPNTTIKPTSVPTITAAPTTSTSSNTAQSSTTGSQGSGHSLRQSWILEIWPVLFSMMPIVFYIA